MNSKTKVTELLAIAGLTPNGSNPEDPQVRDERVYDRILSGGPLAMGESYMDGWWDVERLDVLVDKALRANLQTKVGMNFETLLMLVRARFFNLQDKTGAREVAEEHYDLGNDLYEAFLDPYNQYTCGYFKDTDDLNVAQEQKLDLICRKLGLKKGDQLLDIGCGWGGLAKFAAERYGVQVTGITISDEQVVYAREFCGGLPVSIEKCDYRDVQGSFDAVTAVGMVEHVGYKNYRSLMESAHRVLKDGGMFLLHCIGGNVSSRTSDPWFDKYIFPNGMTPSIAQLGAAAEKLFVIEDWHNFGAYYDPTLMAWFKNFDAAWPTLKEKYGGERFYRMWKYYLLTMAGAFRSRQNNQLWQIVLSKGGVPGGYTSVR